MPVLIGRSVSTVDDMNHGLSGVPVLNRDEGECNTDMDETHECPPIRAEDAKGAELRLY